MADLCKHPFLGARRVSLRKILDLNDENFRRFVQNGCQMPGQDQKVESELAQIKFELAELQSLIFSLGIIQTARTPR